MISENAVLVRPQIDASDKQIFAKNGFITTSENIKFLTGQLNSRDKQKQIFQPKQLGKFFGVIFLCVLAGAFSKPVKPLKLKGYQVMTKEFAERSIHRKDPEAA